MVTKTSAKIHKWLALVLVLPILFWFISGLFFAIAPIERVRSEHMMSKAAPVPVQLPAGASGLSRLAQNGVAAGEKIELRTVLDRPVALIFEGEKRPRLYDLESGRLLSPIPPAMAAQIAARDHAGTTTPARVEAVTKKSTEYKGLLPAWRVDFEDGAGRSLYVAADTGAVTARRSTLWRVFDFLWSLHILDFKEREDFNTPLLIGTTSLALIVIITGIIMFPSRLGYSAWRRRRRRAREG